MVENRLSEFYEFLKLRLSDLPCREGSYAVLRFPEFEYLPYDYLDFAESALLRDDESGYLDCIGHLKKALECEADTFIEVLGLKGKRKKMNLPRKLSFLQKVGIIPSRMLTRMNQIRNRAEHEYAKVNKTDAEQHFDLVYAAVKAVEGAIFMLNTTEDFSMFSEEDETVGLSAHYHFEKPSIEFQWSEKNRNNGVTVESSDWENFQEALSVYFLLIMSQALVSSEYAMRRLPRRHITNAVKRRS